MISTNLWRMCAHINASDRETRYYFSKGYTLKESFILYYRSSIGFLCLNKKSRYFFWLYHTVGFLSLYHTHHPLATLQTMLSLYNTLIYVYIRIVGYTVLRKRNITYYITSDTCHILLPVCDTII